jgi:GNAT superfamily N-acetyltransferase
VTTGTTRVLVRPRRAEDVPHLSDVLTAQQPSSRYPFRDPLPVPVEQFLHAHDAVAAWTAELDGRPVGHVCRLAPPAGHAEAARMNDACARAHGCTVDELGWVATLFLGAEARGLGAGRALLDTVVDDIRGAGLRPCLEVLPVHASAVALYESAGWHDVLRIRPTWLQQAPGGQGLDVRVMVLPS